MAGQQLGGSERGEGSAPASYQGPTYYDVRALAASIEAEYGVRVEFLYGPGHATQRWAASLGWVRAVARTYRGTESCAVVAGSSFGGNSGAATMPGACLAALYDLQDRLDDPLAYAVGTRQRS